MDLGQAQQLAAVTVSVVVAGVAAWKSWRAEQQTRATGNGWAERVERKVDRIEEKIDDHVAAHADAEIARRRR